jgi:hypothetical protein
MLAFLQGPFQACKYYKSSDLTKLADLLSVVLYRLLTNKALRLRDTQAKRRAP